MLSRFLFVFSLNIKTQSRYTGTYIFLYGMIMWLLKPLCLLGFEIRVLCMHHNVWHVIYTDRSISKKISIHYYSYSLPLINVEIMAAGKLRYANQSTYRKKIVKNICITLKFYAIKNFLDHVRTIGNHFNQGIKILNIGSRWSGPPLYSLPWTI